MYRFMPLLSAILLTGCAHVDTGQIDYRVAERPVPSDKIEAQIQNCIRTNDECRPVTQSRLIRKYVGNQAPITAGQVFSIELEQAFIGDNLLEGFVLGHQFGKQGEYAILANAFEFGTGEGSKRFLESTEYNKKPKEGEADVELKLVYYGDDVRKLQPLNFSNIPLLPREQYDGGSVGIQIVIMEVDAPSGPLTSLLKTLAKFGQRSLPGAPEASNILFDLGESLLQGSKDDRIFDFRFVMSSGAAIDESGNLGPIATFAPGRYVFRRKQDRKTPIDWKDVTFDYNSGRLYRGGAEIRNELYFVLNVRKYPQGTEPEHYEQLGWTEFRETVQAAADERDVPLNAVTENLVKLLVDTRSKKWGARLLKEWRAAEVKLLEISHRTASNFDSLNCPASKSRADLVRDLTTRDAQDAIRTFMTTYKAAEDATFKKSEDSEAEPAFQATEREAVVSAMARYFMPWSSPETKAAFASSSAFDQRYAGDGGVQLIEDATSAALSRGAAATDCEMLDRIIA